MRRRLQSKDDVIGQTLYPSPSAGDGKLEEDGFYACKQCGAQCDSQKVSSPGHANDGDGYVTTSGGDPTVAFGRCPFCGTANSR